MEAIKLSIVLAIIITSIVILHFLTHRKEDLNDDVILLEKKFSDSETFKEVAQCWKILRAMLILR